MVARICTASTPLSLIALFGCVWPGAVRPTVNVKIIPPAALNQPFVVLQYWDDGEVLSARVTAECQFALEYSMRFYPTWFTPALGVQHGHPDPCLAVFAKGCRPWFGMSHYGAVCCQAPRPGPYSLTAELRPDGAARTSSDYLEHHSLVQFAERLDQIDRLLARTKAASAGDRAMIYEQLAQLAGEWRDAPTFKTTVSRESLENARRAFERRAGELRCDSAGRQLTGRVAGGSANLVPGQRAQPAVVRVFKVSVGSADPTYPD